MNKFKSLQTKLIPFIQGFSEDVFSQFDPVLGNKVCINRLCSLLKSSNSGLVCQRVCLGGVQDPDQLKLLAGEPARPLDHKDHLPSSREDGLPGIRLVQPYP